MIAGWYDMIALKIYLCFIGGSSGSGTNYYIMRLDYVQFNFIELKKEIIHRFWIIEFFEWGAKKS